MATPSLLARLTDRVRFYADEPSTDAKFSDAYIINEMLPQAVCQVMTTLNHNNATPILLRHTVYLVEDQRQYTLPACVGEVWALELLSTSAGAEGNVLQRFVPGQFHDPANQGFRLEHNILTFTSLPLDSETELSLLYTPSFDFFPHSGTGDISRASGVDTLELDVTPTLGTLDTRDNAYGGAIVRIYPTGGVVEERAVMRSYLVGSEWFAELVAPLTQSTPPLTACSYEVVMPCYTPMVEACALAIAMMVGTNRSFSESRMQRLERQYRISMKTIKDHFSHKWVVGGRSYDPNSHIND